MPPDLLGSSFIAIDLWSAVQVILLGFVGGVLSGFIGSGGAFFMTPGMMNLGVAGPVAVGSNIAHKFGKAIIGSKKHGELGHVDKKLAIFMLITAAVGIRLAVWLMKLMFEGGGGEGHSSPAADLYISAVFVSVLSVVSISMLRDAMRSSAGEEAKPSTRIVDFLARLRLRPLIRFPVADVQVSLWVVLICEPPEQHHAHGGRPEGGVRRAVRNREARDDRRPHWADGALAQDRPQPARLRPRERDQARGPRHRQHHRGDHPPRRQPAEGQEDPRVDGPAGRRRAGARGPPAPERGLHEPRDQRNRRPSREGRAPDRRGRRAPRGFRGRGRRGQRSGDPGARDGSDLRPVLHDQAEGQGHRPRPVGGAGDRPQARRADERVEHRWAGGDVHGPSAGDLHPLGGLFAHPGGQDMGRTATS